MAGYYDYVLVLIPLAMLTIVGLLTTFGWSAVSAAPVGAGVSTLVIGHALFIRAPVDSPVDASTLQDAPAGDSVAPTAD
jgi:hypothetical protein